MRFPSIQAVAREAQRTLARFPVVMLSAAVAVVTGWTLVESGDNAEWFMDLFVTSTLGLPLFLALKITSERLASKSMAVILHTIGFLFLAGFYMGWLHWPDAVQARRYVQVSLGLHLLVAFLPFVRGSEPNAFWQFNRILFLRFLTAMLYSGVLYAGLGIALLAVDQLLKIDIKGEAYARLGILIAFIFNTLFFSSGIPGDLGALEARRDYPPALKVFSQFILIPLVGVYMLILTAYLGKILVTGQWPSGWIGWLVSSVAAVGVLSLLLVHPIRDNPENRWVVSYARWFYIALLPAIGMLLAAIWQRIAQYGITLDRYFVGVLAFWMAGIAVTYIVRRAATIQWIPVTLCIVAFVTAFGPLGAYAVSRRSQIAHLKRVLLREGLLRDGVLVKATSAVPVASRTELVSTLEYLFETHPGMVDAVFPDRPAMTVRDSLQYPPTAVPRPPERAAWSQVDSFMLALDVPEGAQVYGLWSFNFYPQTTKRADVVPIGNLDYHVHLSGTPPFEMTIGDSTWVLEVQPAARELVLRSPGMEPLRFPSDSLVVIGRRWQALQPQKEPEAGERAPQLPQLVAESRTGSATLVLRSFNGEAPSDSVSIASLNADLYLRLRSGP